MTISSDDRTGAVQSSMSIPSVRNAERLPELGDIIYVWFPYDKRLPRHAAIVASEVNPETGSFDIVIFTMSMFKEGGTYRAISYVGQRGDSWDFKS